MIELQMLRIKTIKTQITLQLLPLCGPTNHTYSPIIASSPLIPKSCRHAIQTSATPSRDNPFDKMPRRDVSPHFSFLSHALHLAKHSPAKPCGAAIDPLHCLALKIGALADAYTSTPLVTLYAKAGQLGTSWSLFNGIVAKDVVAWNAMISAYVYSQYFQSAAILFGKMMREMEEFDSTTLLIVLSALTRLNNLTQGQILHSICLKKEIDLNSFLGNALIDMYSKCGDLSSAESVFVRMEIKDTTSWNSMMCGYLYNGCAGGSLSCFREMSFLASEPDYLSLSCVISACSWLGELAFGESVHGLGIKLGYNENINRSVANALVSFYAKCDRIDAAKKIFEGLIDKDVISWNSMIDGFGEDGRVLDAFDCLRRMQLDGAVQLDSVTIITLLSLCGESGLLQQGQAIHGFTLREELDYDLSVKNSLLDMYMKCDGLRFAQLLFTAMNDRDLISWNTMIGGYSKNGHVDEAKVLFRELLQWDQHYVLSTLLVILSSCNSYKEIQFGKSIHALMVKSGASENVSAVNALIYMYVNCGDMGASLALLESILVLADVISWNSIIVGSEQNGYYTEALEALNLMRHESNTNPDSITLVSAISACGNLEYEFHGRLIHGLAHKTMMSSDLRVRNALITMYCRCGDIRTAELLFCTSPNTNLCSWNCIISGFAQNKDGKRALELFHQLDLKPNEMTIVSIISACAQLGALSHGREINGYVVRFGLHQNCFISSALLDMYSKCGRLEIAVRLFRNSVHKSVVSWNVMISSYGFHGLGNKAMKLFNEMCLSGIEMTNSTFIALLSACSHSGMVEEGWKYYNCMLEEFGVEPTTEHQVCMVDMLGRAGRLLEAFEFIKQIPAKAEPGVWGALLSACKEHGNLEMGKSVAEHLFCLEPDNVGYYVSLSNIYAVSGRWNDAVEIREKFRKRGLKKPPGCSLINQVYPNSTYLVRHK